mmetsp:Transcript_11704/g.49074  ORF Transcript_11704/g.49074 Transcript_11704/m.49074 type:complete len:228 (+) Transcript_11704:2521-3204(+)
MPRQRRGDDGGGRAVLGVHQAPVGVGEEARRSDRRGGGFVHQLRQKHAPDDVHERRELLGGELSFDLRRFQRELRQSRRRRFSGFGFRIVRVVRLRLHLRRFLGDEREVHRARLEDAPEQVPARLRVAIVTIARLGIRQRRLVRLDERGLVQPLHARVHVDIRRRDVRLRLLKRDRHLLSILRRRLDEATDDPPRRRRDEHATGAVLPLEVELRRGDVDDKQNRLAS